jgi:hypothetical protein
LCLAIAHEIGTVMENGRAQPRILPIYANEPASRTRRCFEAARIDAIAMNGE